MSRLGFFVPFVLAIVLSLAGCGDDSSGDADNDNTQQSEPTSAEPTDSADPTESLSPTQPSSPAVPPATGDLLELSNVSVRVPTGYRADPPDLSYLRFAFDRDGIQSIALGNTPAVNEELSLGEQARISIKNNVYSEPPAVLEPVEIAGVTMYHYAGEVENEYVEEYGAIYDGSQISINFRLAAATPDADRQQLVDSVMASLALS